MDYERLAEAHQRIADAHANLAGLLQGRSIQPDLLTPVTVAPAPARSTKFSAGDDFHISPCWFWRHALVELQGQLRQHFGTKSFRAREIRKFLLTWVDLRPEDTESCGNSPRWHKNFDNAMRVASPEYWPSGVPVVVRGTGPDCWVLT